MKSAKKDKTMEEVSKGYEEFIKRKELNKKGAQLFERTLRKAAKPNPKKQRGSK